MTRWKAFAIHLAISLAVATLVAALIYFIWYPPPYFEISGGGSLMLLIMSVDIVMGPLLTLIVFKSGKKSLRFDLTVISIVQICAFCYGLSIIASARPVFIVACIDRFIPVAANELDDADLARAKDPLFARRSWFGPILVGAQQPTSGDDQQAMIFSGIAGKDLEKFPQRYVSYARVEDAMLEKAKPLSDLVTGKPEASVVINRFIVAARQDVAQLAYLPLRGRTQNYIMVLSKQTKQPMAALPINPW